MQMHYPQVVAQFRIGSNLRSELRTTGEKSTHSFREFRHNLKATIGLLQRIPHPRRTYRGELACWRVGKLETRAVQIPAPSPTSTSSLRGRVVHRPVVFLQ